MVSTGWWLKILFVLNFYLPVQTKLFIQTKAIYSLYIYHDRFWNLKGYLSVIIGDLFGTYPASPRNDIKPRRGGGWIRQKDWKITFKIIIIKNYFWSTRILYFAKISAVLINWCKFWQLICNNQEAQKRDFWYVFKRLIWGRKNLADIFFHVDLLQLLLYTNCVKLN